MKIVFTIFILFISIMGFAQNGEIVKGNRYFKEGNFDKAAEAYQKAVNKKTGPVAQYNLGNAQYKKEQQTEAIQSYDAAAAEATDPEMKAKALYNKGVLYHQAKKLPEAIDAYKQALRLTPEDPEIRKNLQLALREKKQQDPQQQQQQKPKEQKPKEDKKQQEPPKPQPQKSKLTKKQAEQYLKALEQKEQQLQEKMQKKVGVPSQPEKDW